MPRGENAMDSQDLAAAGLSTYWSGVDHVRRLQTSNLSICCS